MLPQPDEKMRSELRATVPRTLKRPQPVGRPNLWRERAVSCTAPSCVLMAALGLLLPACSRRNGDDPVPTATVGAQATVRPSSQPTVPPTVAPEASAAPAASGRARVCETACSKCGRLAECATTVGTSCKVCASKSVAVRGGFSIDATETTRAQYRAWIETNPATSLMPSTCSSWKSEYHEGFTTSLPGTGEYPADHVDWCDAYAYCAGVGKRLCGRIGGGANAYQEDSDVTKSQWFHACTSGQPKSNNYPYGNVHSKYKCNGLDDQGRGGELAVGSKPGCVSSAPGYAGIYDLSGNVWEWEDSCNGATGTADLCRLRGGSFWSKSDHLDCGAEETKRNGESSEIGFRCCSNP